MGDKKYSILLVEDEENLSDALKLNLELEGYEVTPVYDGLQALKSVKNEYFDLIILDIMLPELDGISVCESIRLQNNEVPILMLSARNSSADRVLGLKKGADDYLTKPFNLEELLLRVTKLINKNNRMTARESLPEEYKFGKNSINFKRLESINRLGKKILLTKREVMLLKLLNLLAKSNNLSKGIFLLLMNLLELSNELEFGIPLGGSCGRIRSVVHGREECLARRRWSCFNGPILSHTRLLR